MPPTDDDVPPLERDGDRRQGQRSDRRMGPERRISRDRRTLLRRSEAALPDAPLRALVVNIRQELAAPVAAICQYARMAQSDAVVLRREQILADLERVIHATETLTHLVDWLLAPEAMRDLLAADDLVASEKRYRHDLRTPINAIKGYGELILEDLADSGLGGALPDLEAMLAETERLLTGLEAIVRFSREGASAADRSALARAVAQDVARSVAGRNPGHSAGIEPGRVLIVDDIETNRALLQRHMERERHSVVLAADGHSALALLQTQPFDLMLLDLMMPGINGLEVLRRVKADPATAGLPVVMISALDELDSVVRCLEDGAEDYLPKPFDPVLLHARVNAILERGQLRARERRILDALTEEKRKSDLLLRSILPEPIVARMSAGEAGIADRFEAVTVLFCDIVGFTEISGAMAPSALVANLDRLFRRFDELALHHGVEKIKTIGDAYMAVAGLPVARPDHAEAAVAMARDIIDALGDLAGGFGRALSVRIGLHSGPATAGVIGTHRFIYDVWGDTVNVASRLENLGLPNRIHISGATAGLLGGHVALECRGSLEVKGKGAMTTYLI